MRYRKWLAAGAIGVLAGGTIAGGSRAATLDAVVRLYGNAAIQQGLTPGLEVAVVIGNLAPRFFGFGVVSGATGTAPNKDTLFQVGSVTKIFTTNLLGQAIYGGSYTLADKLASFTAELGRLPQHTAAVSLKELTDFTGGFPSKPNLCQSDKPAQDGCLPNARPTPGQYGAGDLAAFFRSYATAGPPPHGYIYSDFAIGLAGLLLGATPDQRLDNASLSGWNKRLVQDLTAPLGMRSTWLYVPAAEQSRLAQGYTTAMAQAQVTGGGISGFTLADPGAGYTVAPQVTISGGGGSLAQATAAIDARGSVTGISVTAAGSSYVAPATVTFSGGRTTGYGQAIVAGGHVIGVSIASGGSFTGAATVTFRGGRVGGRDATGTAFVDHDVVHYVSITDEGAGYVPPLTVSLTPSPVAANTVPVWAPAGALKSSAADLARLAAAALRHGRIGTLKVPVAITRGFAIAEQPYACEGSDPSLSGCTSPRSGLAWDVAVEPPKTIAKDGGLPGASSYVLLLPSADAAVVVLANDWTGYTGPAPEVAMNIAYALYHQGLLTARPLR